MPPIVVLNLTFRSILGWTVTWLFGPTLLVGMFFVGIGLIHWSWGDPPGSANQKDRFISRVMAFCAGIIGAIIVIIYDVLVKQIAFPEAITGSEKANVYVAISLIAGFSVTLISAGIRTSFTSSLLIFALAGASIAGLYFYLSLSEVRGTVLISTTSLSMGILICFWWIPFTRNVYTDFVYSVLMKKRRRKITEPE